MNGQELIKARENIQYGIVIHAHMSFEDIERVLTRIEIISDESSSAPAVGISIMVDDLIDHFMGCCVFFKSDEEGNGDVSVHIASGLSFALLGDMKYFIQHSARGESISHHEGKEIKNPYGFFVAVRELIVDIRAIMRYEILEYCRVNYSKEGEWEAATKERLYKFNKIGAEELLKLKVNLKMIRYLRYLGVHLPEDADDYATDAKMTCDYENRVFH